MNFLVSLSTHQTHPSSKARENRKWEEKMSEAYPWRREFASFPKLIYTHLSTASHEFFLNLRFASYLLPGSMRAYPGNILYLAERNSIFVKGGIIMVMFITMAVASFSREEVTDSR